MFDFLARLIPVFLIFVVVRSLAASAAKKAAKDREASLRQNAAPPQPPADAPLQRAYRAPAPVTATAGLPAMMPTPAAAPYAPLTPASPPVLAAAIHGHQSDEGSASHEDCPLDDNIRLTFDAPATAAPPTLYAAETRELEHHVAQAVVWAEILGPPAARRPFPSRRRL